ncbi:MAG TPA: sigma-E processing peptidase SpoIIGA [Syntrophomonas sp.]|nr:sigma-E processing peptidase SpoIIGA [Syntrophomonas sp.]HRW11887.1 sigma-E processing peptidase SpoIIGA [Syntrophomonas sp.]
MSDNKVYADLTFLLNVSMDFLLLWLTARLCHLSIAYRRLLLAACLGGFYGVGQLISAGSILYTLPAKLVVSCLLLLVACPSKAWAQFGKAFMVFYGLSFITAGASLAAASLVPTGEDASWSMYYLVAGVSALISIAIFAERFFRQTLLPVLLKYQVRLCFDNKCCRGQGFLDTGNGLRDPLTHRPIVVAEFALVQSCLPEEICCAMEDDLNEEQRLEALSHSQWGNRVRLIPFSSLGKKNGMLIGLRCDELGIRVGQREMLHKNLVVAIYPYKLSANGDYQLLIPSEVVQQA